MMRSYTALEAIPCWLLLVALGVGCSDPYYDNFNNQPPRYCGDEVKNRVEDCDASDFGGASCGTLGYSGGDLVCSEACTYDTGACLGQVCGDGACVPGEDPAGCAADCSGMGITVGEAHTCSWKGAGAVWCWGVNLSGELGDGLADHEPGGFPDYLVLPVSVSGLAGTVSLSAGSHHTCVAKNDGSAWCWGYNAGGQLGDDATHQTCRCCWIHDGYENYGDQDCSFSPVRVTGLTEVVVVASGDGRSCALRLDGTVHCWGGNRRPRRVSGLADVTAIAVGGSSACALDVEGTVWCWGANSAGQLGDGSTVDRDLPGQVIGLTGVTLLSAGQEHACAALSDGSVWCWGSNRNGKLGDGVAAHQVCEDPDFSFSDIDCSPSPVQVSGAPTAVAVAAGVRHTCIISADGVAWCWGSNEHGQLGDGTTTERSSPVQVTGLGDLAAVATGGYHTCARQLSSRIWCWGANDVGQLGLGQKSGDILRPESRADWWSPVGW